MNRKVPIIALKEDYLYMQPSSINNYDPTQTKSWKLLSQHFEENKDFTLNELFKNDSKRTA
ncbi:hypothetical protein N8385_02555, partial [Cyclobacteriaceae bacterium]|nr:hypothetical protein [Cyclobacteriaceae bacterium]